MLQNQELSSGSLLKFQARPGSGFNFDYFIFLVIRDESLLEK
jgi:hypothetical protein